MLESHLKAWMMFLLVIMLVVFFSSKSFGNHLGMPMLPIGEAASYVFKENYRCVDSRIAELVSYFYISGWVVTTLNGNWVLVKKIEFSKSKETVVKFWLISKLDGHPDHYYELAREQDFYDKHPDPCEFLPPISP